MVGDGSASKLDPRTRARGMWRRVHEMLREGTYPRDAVDRLATEGGISRSTAQRYVSAALLVLQRDDEDEPIATVRARILARYEHAAELARNRTRSVPQPEGGTVEVADPDVGNLLKAIGAIAIIKGVVSPSGREPTTGRFPERPSPPKLKAGE